MIGLSPVQTIIGLTFTILGIIVYVVIPQLLMNRQMGKTFQVLILVYMACSISLCFIGRTIMPWCSDSISTLSAYFQKYFMLNSEPLKQLPILRKNMHAHAKNNLKIGFTFVCIVTLLV